MHPGQSVSPWAMFQAKGETRYVMGGDSSQSRNAIGGPFNMRELDGRADQRCGRSVSKLARARISPAASTVSRNARSL